MIPQLKQYACLREEDGNRKAKARYISKEKERKKRTDHKLKLKVRVKSGEIKEQDRVSIDVAENCFEVWARETNVVQNYYNGTVLVGGIDPFPVANVTFVKNNKFKLKLGGRGNGHTPDENAGHAVIMYDGDGIIACGIITATKEKCKRKGP